MQDKKSLWIRLEAWNAVSATINKDLDFYIKIQKQKNIGKV